MLIYNLSKDAFCLITSHLEFSDVYRLSMTCGPMRRIVTSTEVVTDVFLSLPPRVVFMPSLIYNLPSISRAVVKVSIAQSSPILPRGVIHPCAFGKNLKTLIITGTGGVVLLHSMTTDSSSSFLGMDNNNFNLGAALPNLELLSVDSPYQAYRLPKLIGTLPPSLTSLRLDTPYSGSSNFFAPRHLVNLTHLDLPKCTGFKDATFLPNQLPALTSIHLPMYTPPFKLDARMEDLYIPAASLDAGWASKVPNLTSLKATSFLQLPDEIALLRRLACLQLNIVRNMELVMSCLPPTLTDFSVLQWDEREHGDPSVFCLLPPSLTSFQCNNTRFPAFDVFQSNWSRRREQSGLDLPNWFPPGLTRWSMNSYSWGDMARGYWSLLPSKLKYIGGGPYLAANRLEGESYETSLDIAAKFPLLEQLSLSLFMSQVPVAQIILPPRLERLSLKGLPNFSNHTLALPSTLRRLAVMDLRLPTAGLPILPPNVTYFSYSCSKPPNLVVRREIAPHQPRWKFTDDAFSNSLMHLPSILLSLCLTISGFVLCTKELIQSLPRTLEVLEAKCFHELTDELIPLLPRLLTSISISHAHNVSDAGIKLLPPSLSGLYMKNNRALTPACIDLLPKTLAYLHIPKNRNFPRALYSVLKQSSSRELSIESFKLKL